jgi:membrane associated rhomboid family serine protease
VAGGAAFGLVSTSPLPMVGASGAVFAFLGVWIVADWRRLRARARPSAPSSPAC